MRSLVAVTWLWIALLAGCGGTSEAPSEGTPANSGGGADDESAGDGQGDDTPENGGAAADAPQTYRIAVIPKGTTHEFWKSVHYGAARAAREAGNVQLIWKGPLQENDRAGQINLVENFIVDQVNGICLAPLDSQALIPAVRNAGAEGIPVVIWDSGLAEGAETVTYVATDNYHGGELAARRLAETLNGEGDVILLRYAPGSESTEQREQGFLDVLQKEFPMINILSSDQYSGTTPQSALEKSQQLLLKYQEQVDGVFAVCEPNSTGMLQALQEAGLAGKVKFIAFDPSPRLVQAMADQEIHGIVLQDPVKMGYESVRAIVAHLNGEPVEPRYVTGEYVATPENMNTPEMALLLDPPQFQE